MKNACNFAARFNVGTDDDDMHFDFAVIFTRRKFGHAGMLAINFNSANYVIDFFRSCFKNYVYFYA